MKKTTLSVFLTILVISSILFFFQKEIKCQSSAAHTKEVVHKGSQVSIPAPSVFPVSGDLFSAMWTDPQYIILSDIPEGLHSDFAGQPVIRKDKIYLPIESESPGVMIYNRDGQLDRFVPVADHSDETPVQIQIIPESNEIYVGDNSLRQITVYDLQGKIKSESKTGFNFFSFRYDPVTKHYLFYLVSDGQVVPEDMPLYAITITDAAFKPLHQLFPLSGPARRAPFFTQDRIRMGDRWSWYNPDFSDELYTIDFNGNVNLVLDLECADMDYEARIESIVQQIEDISIAAKLQQIQCVDNFIANEDYIFIGRIPGLDNKELLVNQKQDRGILLPGGMLLTNFGKQFHFAYSRPDFVDGDQWVHFFTARDFNKLMEHVQPQEATAHLPEFLQDDQWLMMMYKPNDEVLFPGQPQAQKLDMPEINIYPNPASTAVNIGVRTTSANALVQIFSTDGLLRYDSAGKRIQPGVIAEIDVSDWTPGAYVVKCTVSDNVFARTLMVQ